MGKSARWRNPPAAGDPRQMRTNKQRIKKTASAMAKQDCGASAVLLSLVVAFGLALVTIFMFTLRADHHGASSEAFSKTRSLGRASGLNGVGRETEEKDELEADTVGVYGYEVVRELDHDPGAFTQGLVYGGNGTLYESTGLLGQSTVREVDLLTGEVRRKHHMLRRQFGEGLTIWKDRLLQVVWKEKKVFVYERQTLLPRGELSHQMQDGWGLTSSKDHIIGSDGTSRLYFMDPDTLEVVRVVTVTDKDKNVGWLNELEFVKNEIWANIWQGDCIARISPEDGKVIGWVLLHGLRNKLVATGVQGIDVLNGIAWDDEEDRVYVTGKLWPKLYEIKLSHRISKGNGSLQAVRNLCNVGHEGFQ